MPNIMELNKSEMLEKEVIKKTDDSKFIGIIIVVFLLIIWLISPPGNKFLQFEYWGTNIKYKFDSIFHKEKVKEYIHLRNNAIFLARMYPKQPKRALYLIDKAIAAIPQAVAEKELPKLYRDRAYIKLFLNDKNGALNDFLLTSTYYDVNDNMRIAVLLTERKQYKMAKKYCENILGNDLKAYYGYVCMSYVFEQAGYLPTAIALYDLAIDNKPSMSKAYVERAKLKKKNNDIAGYDEDIAKAKSLSNFVDEKVSVIDEVINLKDLNLPIR